MKIDILVPSAGESVTEAEIAKWVKQSGDIVQRDEVILELETDKATLEVNAEVSGRLKTIVKAGKTVKIGQVIGVIDTSVKLHSSQNEKNIPLTPSAEKISQSSKHTSMGKRLDIIVPSLGGSIKEAKIGKWQKIDGDFIQKGEAIGYLDTEEAPLELVAPTSGILNVKTFEGAAVKSGDVVGTLLITDAPLSLSTPPGRSEDQERGAYASGYPSPAAARKMAEKNIRAEEVVATGKGGRILKQDVLLTDKEPVPGNISPQFMNRIDPSSHVKVKGTRMERREKMTRIRKTIAMRLVEAQKVTAMLTTFNEVDMMAVMEMRSRYKEPFKKKHNVGIGFMSFFVKAVCSALRTFPLVNAFIDGNEVVYHDYYDIGIAVSTPNGLVVPVIRNAGRMSFAEIEAAVVELAGKGKEGKLNIDEMTGGTFTITNGGVFGSMLSTPILNRPQSGILGMHKIVKRPMAIGDEVKIRPIMYLALTYDHRLLDGAQAVQFLVHIKESIEDPARLLIDV